MDGLLRWLRSAGSARIALPVLILLLAVGGYLLTSTTISGDRDAAASRRAQVGTVQTQEVLGRARAYVAGLGDVLATEPRRDQSRFAQLARATAASVGLNDVLWVQSVRHAGRRRYERRHGASIVHLTSSGLFERARVAPSYLPATFTSRTRPELRPGVDMSGFPALHAAIRDRATVFSVSASRPGALGGEPGFYLLEAAAFGRGRDNRGFLVAFVPRGWFTTTLEGDPRRVAISQNGRRVDGELETADAAASFEALGRRWRIDVAREPPSGLQSTLPWLALAWPLAVALIVLLVVRAIMLRRRAEREYEEVFNLSPIMLCTVGFDGYYKQVNPSFVQTLGYPREQLMRMPYMEIAHPDDVSLVRDEFAGVLAGEEVSGLETRVLTAEGAELLLQWNARAVPEERVVYAIAIDITERRRAEKEAQEMFERSMDLLASAGFDGYYRRVNPAFMRTLGYSKAEILSKPYTDFIHPDDVERSREAFAGMVLGGEEVIGFEARWICADGSVRWIQWNIRSAPDEDVMYGVGRDVTDSRRAQREFEEVFNLSPDLLCIAGFDGYFKRVNPAFQKAFGFSSEELLSRPLLEFGHPADADASRDALERLLRGEDVSQFENRNIRADESILWLEWSARPLPQERIIYAAARDVTERKRAEGQLSRAQEVVEASRVQLAVYAEDQAALRRVATLVARGMPRAEVLDAVGEEVRDLLGANGTHLLRYEADGTATLLATQGELDDPPVGTSFTLEGENVVASVKQTGRTARMDSYEDAPGSLAALRRESGVRSGVGAPIVVEGGLWGVMTALWTRHERPPASAESRMTEFTELVATAIANAESRAELGERVEEQAALRRVATLVARGVPRTEVLSAVAEEIGMIAPAEGVHIYRYEPDGTAVAVATWSTLPEKLPVGTRHPPGGYNIPSLVLRTGRAARIDDPGNVTGAPAEIVDRMGVRSALGNPIIVEGALWGLVVAATTKLDPLPPAAEQRIAAFTELVATAIANAESRAELGVRVDEQAALRRVATLVVRGVPPDEIFSAVAEEVRRLFDANTAAVARFEDDGSELFTVGLAQDADMTPMAERWKVDAPTVAAEVFRTGRPARVGADELRNASGPAADEMRQLGDRSTVASPIIVEGRLWGVIGVSTQSEPLPAGTEERMANFSDVVATSIANAESRAALDASRARVIVAGAEERQRVVRDLHDGAQQRLVHAVITLKIALRDLEVHNGETGALVSEALEHAEHANSELRELVHGILPGVLTSGGLRAGVEELASRSSLPVEVDVSSGRFPSPIEATAYFVVSEALTNVVKHANAEKAKVAAQVGDGVLQVEVSDDGVGGADPDRGSGLTGLKDRVEALGGAVEIASPAGHGTTLVARIPAGRE